MSRKRRILSGLLAAAALLVLSVLPALAEDYVLEEDGSKWYADRVVMPDGTVIPIVDHDNGETQEEDNTQPTVVDNGDGSVTVITADEDNGVRQNEDGSVTVESGAVPIIEATEPPRELTPEEWDERMQRIADKNGAYTPTAYRNGNGTVTEVAVIYMGTGRSLVEMNGVRQFVNTVDLTWETEAPEDQVLAMIYTPKNGHAVLRSGKSKKSTAMMQCLHRYVVRVLAVGKHWTFVDYNGTRGYVQTTSLEFCANDRTEFRTAQVSFRGKTKGKNTVHVRSATGVQLEEYPMGTPITVFDDNGKYCEIEVEGHHCYIASEFVTYDEPETVAAATPEETPEAPEAVGDPEAAEASAGTPAPDVAPEGPMEVQVPGATEAPDDNEEAAG